MKKTPACLFVLAIFLFIAGIFPVYGSPYAATAGVEGRAFIIPKGTSVPVKLTAGMELNQGDRIVTSPQSQAVIFYYNGFLKIIGENSSYIVDPDNPSIDRDSYKTAFFHNPKRIFSSHIREDLLGNILFDNNQAGRNQDIVLITPSFRILENRPCFRWDVKEQETDFYIVVEDENSKIIWSEEITGRNSIEYPSYLPPLGYHMTYYWYLRKKDESRENVTVLRSFNLAPPALVRDLNDIEMLLTQAQINKSAVLFMKANFLKSRDLIEPAIDVFQSLARLHPQDKYPYEELILLYQKQGDLVNLYKTKNILKQLSNI